MLTCTRRIQFCAGHRVMGHENKCAHLHGHNYVVEITASALLTPRQLSGDAPRTSDENGLDSIGRVIDFTVLKERIGGWIERYWDHGFLLHKDDQAVIKAIREFQRLAQGSPSQQKTFVAPFNPTAENMAYYLLHHLCPAELQGSHVVVTKVVVHETENCKAEAILDDID